MAIRVCVAGVSGKTGGEVARAILASKDFDLTGAIARRSAGRDVGELLGMPENGIIVSATLEEALVRPADVLVDFTSPDSVKQRTRGRPGPRRSSGDWDFRADGSGLPRH